MQEWATPKPIEILLVEDNPGDVRLTLEAFKEGKVQNHIEVVNDGVEAMAFLRREAPYFDVQTPDLILLDLNLPRKDGREVLREIKEDDILKSIPVIILTTSKTEQDILMTYHLHANCYLIKPIQLDDFLKLIRSLEEFWLSVVRLPSHAQQPW
jgi:chemotaxis family two-component system response regulator Rcp1